MELKMGGKNLIKSNRKVILEGMRDGIPIGLGYLAVSFSLVNWFILLILILVSINIFSLSY